MIFNTLFLTTSARPGLSSVQQLFLTCIFPHQPNDVTHASADSHTKRGHKPRTLGNSKRTGDKGQGSTCSHGPFITAREKKKRPSGPLLIILEDNEHGSAALHCAIPLTFCLALVMSRMDAFPLFTQPVCTQPFAKF